MNRHAEKLCVGLAAGLAATAPMTLLIRYWHRRLPPRQRYGLPPDRVAGEVLRELHAQPTSEVHQTAAARAAHYLFGATMGGAFAAGAGQDRLTAKGIGFGLCVWTASYLGLMPAVGMKAAATREPPNRNLMMIAAHVLWGAVLGGLVAAAQRARLPAGRHRRRFGG
jgi:hypothetical protein